MANGMDVGLIIVFVITSVGMFCLFIRYPICSSRRRRLPRRSSRSHRLEMAYPEIQVEGVSSVTDDANEATATVPVSLNSEHPPVLAEASYAGDETFSPSKVKTDDSLPVTLDVNVVQV